MVTAHPVPHPPRNPGKGEMPGLSRRRPRMGREMGSPVRRPQAAGAATAQTADAAPPPRNRWFVDSPLEGDGFEPMVPRHEKPAL